ncbi:MLO-like protein 4, partial [Zea mays]
GVISLLLSQTACFISEICVPSSLFTSCFYICFESDYQDLLCNTDANQTALDSNMFGGQRLHVCGEGHEPFVLYEGLEQLHRFLFILGITHVLYSFVTVVLSMIKIYSRRKWETLAGPIAAEELKAAQAARRAAPTVSLPRLASRRAMASTKAPGPGEKHHSIDAQLRQLVPGKVSEDDKLIEYDVLLVDRFLNIL